MTITLTLPDDIAQHPDPGREALETLAIEGYRSSALTSQVLTACVRKDYCPNRGPMLNGR